MATTQQAPARTQQNGGLTRPQEDSRLATQFIPFGAKDAIKLSVKIVQEMICVPSRSGKVCNETEAIKFMMFCKAKALNPFEGDCFLLGYDSEDGKTASFSLITAHQAYLKRAEVHPEFDGMDSGLIVKQKDGSVVDREGDFLLDDDFILGGWAVVHFKTRKHPMKKRVALKVFNTGKSRWKKDPAGMIVKVAESDALRSSFPTMLGPLGVPDQMMSLSQFDPAATQMPCLDTTKQTQAPAQIESADHAAASTQGDASEIPDDEASQRMAMEIQDAIDGAANAEEHAAVRAKLDATQETLGDATYIALVRMWRAKGKEIGVK